MYRLPPCGSHTGGVILQSVWKPLRSCHQQVTDCDSWLVLNKLTPLDKGRLCLDKLSLLASSAQPSSCSGFWCMSSHEEGHSLGSRAHQVLFAVMVDVCNGSRVSVSRNINGNTSDTSTLQATVKRSLPQVVMLASSSSISHRKLCMFFRIFSRSVPTQS